MSGTNGLARMTANDLSPQELPEPKPGEKVSNAASDPTDWALLAAFVALLLVLTTETFERPPSVVTPPMWVGRVVVVLGGVWTIYARWVLGRNYQPTAHNHDPEQVLVRSGPYRWFRHPQYAGNTLSVVGLLLALSARWSWLLVIPFLAAQLWRVRREEAFLREKFDSDA